MIKKFIAPLQKILLQKGICPGCAASLSKAKIRIPLTMKTSKIVCSCGRKYIHDREVDTYTRASE